jgi:hypothetical protein
MYTRRSQQTPASNHSFSRQFFASVLGLTGSARGLQKRALTGILIAIMILNLAACSGSSQTPAPAASPSPSTVSESAVTIPSPTPTPTPTPRPDPGKAEITDPNPDKSIASEIWGEVVVNQVGVILQEGQTLADAEKIAAKYEGKVLGEIELMNMYQLKVKATTEDELVGIMDSIALIDGVVTVFPNTRQYPLDSGCVACSPFNDPTYSEGHNGVPYQVIGVKNAWDIIKASCIKMNNVHVGVMDTALYKGSDELSGKSSIAGDTTEQPETDDAGNVVDGGYNHGTMVTQVIGADPDNGGVVGVAGKLGKSLKVTVTNMYKPGGGFKQSAPDPNDPSQITWTDGKAYTCNTFKDMINQIKNGATIINCSFGPDHPEAANKPTSDAYKIFLQNVAQKYPDVIFVAAAGNENGGLDGSNYSVGGHQLPNLITVGALNDDGTRANFSNYSTANGEVTISAPGVKIPMAVGPDGKTVSASGTSFATPMVAAAAAMIRSINPKLTADEIKHILVDTSAPGVPGQTQSMLIPDGMGAGVLAVDKAVLKVINDLRVANGEKALDEEQLKKLATIDGTVESTSPGEFTVTAKVEAVNGGGTDLTIELQGEGAIGGSTTKHVASAGEASWKVSIADPKSSATVKISRTDTEAACQMPLETIDIAGQWDGNMVITDAKVSKDITIPDPFGSGPPQVITKQECENSLKDAKGKPIPFSFKFTPDSPTSGTAVLITQGNSGAKETSAMAYTYTGGKVVYEGTQEGASIHFEGQTSVKGDNYELTGTWTITEVDGSLTLIGTFSVTKPKPTTP